ncbi:MAG: CCA tRNA nucleotidyltransferase [Planctomycetota bacterium]|nr:CCA tRNA nucleotidyltransferase [Planctomycetota bacterium]
MATQDERASRAEAFARAAVERLARAGHRALWAGGCVRDRLLGRVPKDYDVATSARPGEVQALFPRTHEVGASFGVVCVLEPGPPGEGPPLQLEVATFRRDGAYADGRHPVAVEFSGEAEDARRRDFTVNGLFYDPLKDELLDYVNGRADLKARLVRAIGDPAARFEEDRLRLLRAVRFAAQLGFELEAGTFAALKAHAPGIGAIARERVREELTRMLAGPDPRRAFELLKASGLLKAVLPEVDALAGVAQPPQFHPEGDVWTHTLMLLGQLRDAPPSLAWAALLHDVGKPPTFAVTDRIRFNEHEKVGAAMAEAILLRLRASNEFTARVVALVRQHMAFKDLPNMRAAKRVRFLRQPHFDEHLELHRIDCLASHGSLENWEFGRRELAALGEERLRPPRLLDGEDLKALGLPPGPRYKEILEAVEDLQLEGALTSREEALAHVRRTYVDAGP